VFPPINIPGDVVVATASFIFVPMKAFETQTGTDIRLAVYYLSNDELVGIPTETVYGLAANAFSETAIAKVFQVKQRPASNPLIVHVAGIEDIRPLVSHVPATAEALLKQFSPGPLTVLLKKNPRLPGSVSGGRAEVAFRIPAHPLTLALLRSTGFPLVAPSANLYTTISPTHPSHVLKNLSGKIPYILDGGSCTVGIESTVVGFDEDETPVIYRHGAVTPAEIKSMTGRVRVNEQPAKVLSPGQARLHYSPKTPLYLTDHFQPLPGYNLQRTGILCFKTIYPGVPAAHQFVLSTKGDLAEAARNVYKGLHYLDELRLEVLVAEKCPEVGLGNAINDRLTRAANQAEKQDG
jgi:L-threonylcarbamoyladenylate synthase